MTTYPHPATEDKDIDQEGATTAEFAIMLPALVFILALVLGACAVGICQLKLQESARLGARAAARGEAQDEITRIVHSIDESFAVAYENSDGTATITVSTKTPGIIGRISSWEQKAQASVALEYAPESSQSREAEP